MTGGYTTYTCACGDSYQSDETAARGHSYNAVVTEPTCTTGGYTTYICACGNSYQSDETAALGHSYNKGICSQCGEEEPEPENLDAIFEDALDLLDIYWDGVVDPEYIVFEIMWYLGVYDWDTDIRISAEEFESTLDLLFRIDDEMLQRVREFTEFDAESQTYRLNYYSGGGGRDANRVYTGYVKNGSTYEVYFEHVTRIDLWYAFSTEEEYWAFFDEHHGEEFVEYDGYIYEIGIDGYSRIDSYDGYGKKYTVEYSNGILRLLAWEDFED